MTAHPAGYSRAAGIALVVAAVAGAASQDDEMLTGAPAGEHCLHWQEGDADCCRCGLANWCAGGDEADDPPPVTGCPGISHCDCYGHRYAGDHVPGRPCPCFKRDAWEGTR